MMRKLRVAVQGCCHGELDLVYESIADANVDLLLICGDFQSIRTPSDLNSMAVPRKYRKMNTFHHYFSGKKTAPVATILIGGNHEASNVLQSLYYGGWIAPNIYFLGYAGVVWFGGLRIAGLSGIYHSRDYHRGHYERPPFSENSLRSIYHLRELEVYRMMHLARTEGSAVDVFMSHDWPSEVWNHGNKAMLLRKKPFFREDMTSGKLGSPPLLQIMQALKPKQWFAAHLHVKFEAFIPYPSSTNAMECTSNGTKFLVLDKAIKGRHFIQVLDIDTATSPKSDKSLSFDVEWMTILRKSHHLLRSDTSRASFSQNIIIAPEDHDETRRMLAASYGEELLIPMLSLEDFARSLNSTGNLQTDRLLATFDLSHIWTSPSSSMPLTHVEEIDTSQPKNATRNSSEYAIDADLNDSILSKRKMIAEASSVICVTDIEKEYHRPGSETNAVLSTIDANEMNLDDI